MAEAARIRDPRSGGTANRTGRDACRRVMDNPCRQQIRSRGPIPNGSVLGSRPPPELRDSALVECLCGEDDFALKIRGQTGQVPVLHFKNSEFTRLTPNWIIFVDSFGARAAA